ncbi:MAG: T9SS type A sorting domain-containing protein [Bacteroidales bacterium]|nr:T9SS type A sorting domain-containing protein [Bacteroidales bacterium]
MKKQHFLQLALVDSTGHIMSRGDFQGYEPLMNIIADGSLSRDLFNVDKYGNIYLCRQAYDIFTYDDGRTLSVQDGTIAALKIYVDGQPTHTIYPDQRYNKWNHIVMKFSPDFDSLYWSHYIFKADSNYNTHILGTSYVTSINIDNDDNFYITLNCSQARDSIINKANIPLNKSDSLFFHFRHSELWHGCMIAFNQSQEPIYIRKLTYGDTSCTTSHSHSFFSTAIDEESCSIFLLGKATFGDRFNSIPSAQFSIGGDSLDLRYNAFWCRLDKTTGRLLSYGKARSDVLTTISGSAGGASGICTLTNLVVHNNRVISEVHYQRDISFLDTTIMMASTDWGLGMMMWDYDGNEIGYVDFQSNSPTNLCGSMLLQDSVLYLAGTLTSDADLGEHHIYGSGAGRAFVAKYVDTAFMHPYVRPDLREPQSIIWNQDLNFSLADSPVTLTATSTSGLPVSYSSSDTSIARIDGSTLHLLAGGSCTILATCPDNDYYQPAAPVSKTLTVGQSGIADISSAALIQLYPNPTTGKIRVIGESVMVSEIQVLDLHGRLIAVFEKTDKFDLSAIPAGVYFVRIKSKLDGSTLERVTFHKLIKK